jgi:hypothetical protein
METLNNFHYNARRILILGTTGQGKTTAALRLVRLLPADLIFVYDWQGGEFAERIGVAGTDSRAVVGQKIEEGQRIICYNPGDKLGEAAQLDDFDWWCDMVMEVSGRVPGRKLAVIDEADELMTNQKIPDALYRILKRGRRRQIDTILIASAANAMHNKGRNQVSELFCFKCVDENALTYPTSLGLDGATIAQLAPGRFSHLNLVTGQRMELALWDGKSKGKETQPKEISS